MQQGVQTNATCNIQQWHVGSFWPTMLLYRYANSNVQEIQLKNDASLNLIRIGKNIYFPKRWQA